MKIGVFTFSDAINYGAMLQCYALPNALRGFGAEVDILNYPQNNWVSGRKYYRKWRGFKNFLYNFIVAVNLLYRKSRRTEISYFDAFRETELGISGERITTKEQLYNAVRHYDALITGSDQVWNLELTQDETYFLPFHDRFPDIRLYSYAASVARDITPRDVEMYFRHLRRFSAVSVRERQAAEQLAERVGLRAETCVDPVFLLTRERWAAFAEKSDISMKKPYIFAFFIGRSSENQKYLDRMKALYGAETVLLDLFPLPLLKADTVFRHLDIYSFVNLISNADAVITDSFHATAFSVIFGRDFYAVAHAERGVRILNLLALNGQEERGIGKPDDIRRRLAARDGMAPALRDEIEKSLQYLQRIVGDGYD